MQAEFENHVTDMLPGFVLSALTDEETSRVADHLAGCPSCRDELASLQQVADDLPLALAQSSPPPHVKEKLMRAIHSSPIEAAPTARRSSWHKLTDFFRSPLPAIGLALIVLLTLGNLLLWRQLNRVTRQATTPMRVVALTNTQAAPGASGTLVMDQQGEYGTIVVDNLAVLSAKNQYQVWLIRDGERVSGGVFSVNPQGYASLEIMSPIPLVQYDSIGISVEPYGGSPAQTGVKVLGGVIPH